ncbi:MAG TPA: DUF11 domain-containing protein, partial [Chloroflexi bacterium]|nr:DUF11 domain-containing protein [Chloroflexota bacterium]
MIPRSKVMWLAAVVLVSMVLITAATVLAQENFTVTWSQDPATAIAGQPVLIRASVHNNNGDVTADTDFFIWTGGGLTTLDWGGTWANCTFTTTHPSGGVVCTDFTFESEDTYEWFLLLDVPSNFVTGSDLAREIEAFYQHSDGDTLDSNHTVAVFTEADLAVTKLAKPDFEVRAGENFEYTIFVDNFGPSDARDVVVTDDILSSAAFTLVGSISAPNYSCTTTGTGASRHIECVRTGALVAGGRDEIKLTVTSDTTSTIDNTVLVTSLDPDPDVSNNTAHVFTSVTDVADLSVDKYLSECWYDGMDGDLECVAGGYAEFRVEVWNSGPSMAENVVVEDLLPAGVTVVEVYGDGGCTTGIPGDPLAQLTCNLGNIPSLEGRAFNVVVQIDPDYVDAELPFDSRPLENDAWVYSDIFDPDNSNNRDHLIMDVYTLSQLAITKWGFPEVAGAGDDVEYEIRIRNAGPSTADMVHFVDLLPPTVDYNDYFIEQGTGTCTYHENLPWAWWQEYRGVHCYIDQIPPNGVVMVHLLGTYNENLWWAEYYQEVCNIVPDDDLGAGGDYFGVDDPFDMPGWFADSYIEIPFENSPIWGEPAYFGWCPDEFYVEADLSIAKTSEPMKIYPGEQKVYHIEVTNNGPTGAPEVTVTDTLPISVTYEIDNGDCELMGSDPDVLQCYLGHMMPGETKGFDVWALVSGDAPPGEITNEAYVFMDGEVSYEDPNEENNWASATNLVLEPTVADLSLEKLWGPAPTEWFDGAPFGPEDCYPNEGVVRAGCPLTFSLTISNTGPLQAENVVVEDLMPAGVTVEGVGPSQGSCTTGIPGDPTAPLTCNLGNIPRDEGAGIEVFVQTDADLAWEMLENDAVVSSDVPDPDNGNNRAHVLIWVEPFSYLYVEKHGPDEIWAGDQIEYWIDLRNEGPSTAHDVYVDDEMPGGVSLLDAQVMVGEGSCEPDSALCSLGDMEPWENRAVRVRGYVEPWLEEGTVVTNTVRAWANSPFFQPVPDQPISDTWETLVHSAADLSVWKTASPWKVFAGEQVMYEVSVTNNGPGHAYGVLVTDTLPAEVGFELTPDPACYPLDGQVVCEWGMLAAGESRAVQIFGRVDPAAEPGTVSNSVEVNANDTYDPEEYNDYASAPILIQGRADLRVQKFGKPEGEVRAGDKLTYTVIVDNLGTGYAHNVTLDDFMTSDGSFDLMEVTSNRDALCDPETGTFQHDLHLMCALSDTLEVKGPAPGSGRWMITVVVIASEPQDINNGAYVAGSDYDPDLSNNEAWAEHEITAVADLALSKEAWGEMLVGCEGETELWLNQVAAGGTVTYTLTVSNTGPST